jgi:hypothetical protein
MSSVHLNTKQTQGIQHDLNNLEKRAKGNGRLSVVEREAAHNAAKDLQDELRQVYGGKGVPSAVRNDLQEIQESLNGNITGAQLRSEIKDLVDHMHDAGIKVISGPDFSAAAGIISKIKLFG